jgi:8-amino-7-oxononanoate synthase
VTTPLNDELRERLETFQSQGLHRALRRVDSGQSPRIEIQGRQMLNFSSNDYLGLAGHPLLKEAAIRALERYGCGSGASRLICGSLALHHQIEEAIAAFKRTEAALLFSSGYSAALGAITALMGKDDFILLDKRVHASLVDAARLCGAALRVFPHNDLNALEDLLGWADRKAAAHQTRSNVLVVTESVFSMDGDQAPLEELVELKQRFGAWLLVDEAHATGLYGKNRSGLIEAAGLSERIEIQLGTLGKALGASGGFICGSKTLTDFLVNRARSFIFSTAPAPAAFAPASAAICLVQSEEGERRVGELWKRVDKVLEVVGGCPPAVGKEKFPPGRELSAQIAPFRSAIIPLMIGNERKAVELAACLFERGIYIPAIRYPTVARGKARLRLTLSASHTLEEVNFFLSVYSGLA